MGFIVKPLFHREWLSLSAYGTETGQNIFDVFLLLFRISEFSAMTDFFIQILHGNYNIYHSFKSNLLSFEQLLSIIVQNHRRGFIEA